MRTLLLLLLPLGTRAAEICPWMNAATAGGFLGVNVSVAVTRENNNRDDMVCAFQGPKQDLRIDVQTMDTPRAEYKTHSADCASGGEALKAIGNEAVLCGVEDGTKGRRTAKVVGRVRTRIFTILVSTTDPALSADTLREKARGIAEQVAGVLF